MQQKILKVSPKRLETFTRRFLETKFSKPDIDMFESRISTLTEFTKLASRSIRNGENKIPLPDIIEHQLIKEENNKQKWTKKQKEIVDQIIIERSRAVLLFIATKIPNGLLYLFYLLQEMIKEIKYLYNPPDDIIKEYLEKIFEGLPIPDIQQSFIDAIRQVKEQSVKENETSKKSNGRWAHFHWMGTQDSLHELYILTTKTYQLFEEDNVKFMSLFKINKSPLSNYEGKVAWVAEKLHFIQVFHLFNLLIKHKYINKDVTRTIKHVLINRIDPTDPKFISWNNANKSYSKWKNNGGKITDDIKVAVAIVKTLQQKYPTK